MPTTISKEFIIELCVLIMQSTVNSAQRRWSC